MVSSGDGWLLSEAPFTPGPLQCRHFGTDPPGVPGSSLVQISAISIAVYGRNQTDPPALSIQTSTQCKDSSTVILKILRRTLNITDEQTLNITDEQTMFLNLEGG